MYTQKVLDGFEKPAEAMIAIVKSAGRVSVYISTGCDDIPDELQLCLADAIYKAYPRVKTVRHIVIEPGGCDGCP